MSEWSRHGKEAVREITSGTVHINPVAKTMELRLEDGATVTIEPGTGIVLDPVSELQIDRELGLTSCEVCHGSRRTYAADWSMVASICPRCGGSGKTETREAA